MATSEAEQQQSGRTPFFQTRGVVITPADLTLEDWPERAKSAGLTTIALHPFPGVVREFVESEAGRRFLGKCHELGLQVEYELHAMSELLPRELFERNPECFRMDDKGARTPDSNLCVHSERALEIVGENAVAMGKVLKPATHRYFYWGDDGKPWCRCPKCRDFSESDQALLLEHRMLEALREVDADAQVAHLAYADTLAAPKRVAPQPGIFLEFAPIHRRLNVPLDAAGVPENEENLRFLKENLALFRADTAQVLEYWLDCSLFSKWKPPHVKVPWSSEVFAADLNVYGSRGIRHVTTFAVYIDADYVATHGGPPIDEYGKLLSNWPPLTESA